MKGARVKDQRHRDLEKNHVDVTRCVDRKCSLLGCHIHAHQRVGTAWEALDNQEFGITPLVSFLTAPAFA